MTPGLDWKCFKVTQSNQILDVTNEKVSFRVAFELLSGDV